MRQLIRTSCAGVVEMEPDSNDRIIVIKNGDGVVFRHLAIKGEIWQRWPSKSNVLPQISVANGATCTKCKKDYPYADSSNDFICWSCDNGY